LLGKFICHFGSACPPNGGTQNPGFEVIFFAYVFLYFPVGESTKASCMSCYERSIFHSQTKMHSLANAHDLSPFAFFNVCSLKISSSINKCRVRN